MTYFQNNSEKYGLSRKDLSELIVTDVTPSEGGTIQHVYWRQEVACKENIEVCENKKREQRVGGMYDVASKMTELHRGSAHQWFGDEPGDGHGDGCPDRHGQQSQHNRLCRHDDSNSTDRTANADDRVNSGQSGVSFPTLGDAEKASRPSERR